MIVLDTDHLGELQMGTSSASNALKQRLESCGEPIATTIITVEEQLRGWLAAIHAEPDPSKQIRAYGRLGKLFAFFAAWTVLPWNETSVMIFEQLRGQKVRVGTMDLKIGSITLSYGAKLLSRNQRDFAKIPDLIVEDWLS